MAGCGDSEAEETDTGPGPVDSAVRDAGRDAARPEPDAAEPDAAEQDAATGDAGGPDEDASAPDDAMTPDAAPLDAAPDDAGGPDEDASAPEDATAPDATELDASSADAAGDDGGSEDLGTVDMGAPGDARLTVEPSSHAFGAVGLGATSAPATIRVRNDGGAASGPLALAIVGAAAADFAVTGCAGLVLAPGEACDASVTFSPSLAGSREAALEVRASPGGTVTSTLSGHGGSGAMLTIAPSRASFGVVVIGARATQTLIVRNVGAGPSGVPSASLPSGPFGVEIDGCTAALEPGGTCSLTVRFAPSAIARHAAELRVTASPGGTAVAPLDGIGSTPFALTLAGLALSNTAGASAEPEGCVSKGALPMADQDGHVAFAATLPTGLGTFTCTLSGGPTSRAPVTCEVTPSSPAGCNCLPGAGYAFSGLASGTYTLTVSVVDPVTTVTRSLAFEIDETAPVITLPGSDSTFPGIEPLSGLDGSAPFVSTLDAATTATAFVCTLDATPVTCSPVVGPSQVQGTYELPAALSQGPHAARVTGTDCVGNSAFTDRAFNIDNAAPYQLSAPEVTQVDATTTQVVIMVQDAVTNVQNLVCTVDGSPLLVWWDVPPPSSGLTLVALGYFDNPSPGPHSFACSLVDYWLHAGSTSSVSFTTM